MERNPYHTEQNVEQTLLYGRATSRGIELKYHISQNSFTVEDESGSLSFIMTPGQLLFLSRMSRYPDQDFLDGDIKAETPELTDEKTIDIYRGAMKAFGAHPIRDNYIKFGVGKSSRYAHLSNSEDCSLVVQRGIDSIDVNGKYEELRGRELRTMSYTEVKLLRQLKPYIRLEKAYNSDEEVHRSRRKILGATILSTVTIGGTIYYIHKK